MDLINGNVDMHFENILIPVDKEGHDLFQRVSSGIKAVYKSVTGKDVRETPSSLVNARYELKRTMNTSEEGHANVT